MGWLMAMSKVALEPNLLWSHGRGLDVVMRGASKMTSKLHIAYTSKCWEGVGVRFGRSLLN